MHPRLLWFTVVFSLALILPAQRAEAGPWSCTENDTAQALAASNTAIYEEWRQFPALRRNVGNFARYKNLRALYIQAGVCNVGLFMSDALTTTRFLGRPMRVHIDVVEALSKASTMLNAEPTQDRRTLWFPGVGTFQARSMRTPYGPKPKLSRHGLGMAMDIDPLKNPFLSREDLAALHAISGIPFERSTTIPAGKRWDQLHDITARFRTNIGPWSQQTAQRIRTLRNIVRHGDTISPEANELRTLKALYGTTRKSRRLAAMRKSSFLSLPRAFVVAMEDVGFVWATDFPSGADLMHFEYRNAP